METERLTAYTQKEKTGFEVLDEIQEIAQPLCEYATILNMLIGYFSLDKLNPDTSDDKRLIAGRKDIHNTISLVYRGILDVGNKLENFDLHDPTT